VTVVVTGAASGIGAAVVARLTAGGARVVALDATPADGVRPFDVTDQPAWTALAAELGAPVHGLVNCAGTTWRARLGDVTTEAFRFRAAGVPGQRRGRDPARAARPGRGGRGVIAFLLSDAASFVSGAEIPVDGGAGSHGGAKSISDALRPAYQ
jgi:NAD(P)-dependent dehydrogenase (short-subunit alcohol dehydrogenase family)